MLWGVITCLLRVSDQTLLDLNRHVLRWRGRAVTTLAEGRCWHGPVRR